MPHLLSARSSCHPKIQTWTTGEIGRVLARERSDQGRSCDVVLRRRFDIEEFAARSCEWISALPFPLFGDIIAVRFKKSGELFFTV